MNIHSMVVDIVDHIHQFNNNFNEINNNLMILVHLAIWNTYIQALNVYDGRPRYFFCFS